MGSQPETWPAAGVLIVAVVADRLLYPSGPTRSLYTAMLMTISLGIVGVSWADASSWESPTLGEWIVGAVVLGAVAAAMQMVRPPTSRGDFRNVQLAENRVLAARLLVAVVLLAGLLYPGGPIIPVLSPLWAGVIAIPSASWVRRRVLRPM